MTSVWPTFKLEGESPGLAEAIRVHCLPSPYLSLAIWKSVSPFLTVYEDPEAATAVGATAGAAEGSGGNAVALGAV
ncbi:MAG: hypothetical protein JWN24_2824 [Phycisphaerales bacterium]|nr:hypothetical protein [Phycisphaerales bacterium]